MIAQNLNIIEEKISETCLKTGRKRHEIKLIVVSKTQSIEVLKTAIELGIRDFGENKAQELKEKAEKISEKINWHFIGHLQTNKVKYIINFTEYIHSIDSIKIADEVNKRAESIKKVQKILLEVNTSGENTKFGLTNELELLKTAEYCAKKKNLSLVGLMTMAPFTREEKLIRKSFIRLRELKEFLNSSGLELTELSMGMSNDYQIAIEEGATMLRIGTALFGQRNN
ncbi:YggS family pyridoxal phosphate-dependent enzyme [Melioribacteraceae bacterium 4301-Me]|uniref:YggS family pyridoxal phosphate-dependent enzyme n=1 Tax=Pyranulibacter aquaticus TaxID=3163344 RepID=UPI003597221B